MPPDTSIPAAMARALEGVAKVDAHRRYANVSEAYAAITGHKVAELIGRDWLQAFHEDDHALVSSTLDRAEQAGAATREARAAHNDGSTLDVLLTLVADHDSNGARAGHVCFLQDIGLRKQRDRLKDELIATVSHELRTPLTSIKGALALAAALGRGQLPEKVEELLHVAHRNAERLATLVDDLLAIERFEAGAFQPKLTPCVLDALLKRAVADNAVYAAAFDVAYALEIEPGLPRVSLDPARFLQVMANLLSNAAKFSSCATTVEICATRVGSSVAVAVRDQGPGIPEQLQTRIYEKFAQLNPATQRDRGGTGLGLNITRHLVHLMGGEIACASKLGEGTTFTVTFAAAADDDTVARRAVA